MKENYFSIERKRWGRKGDAVFHGFAFYELNNMVLTRASYPNDILEVQRKDDDLGKCSKL